MATPTTPASTSAAPANQGTIVFVQGEAYLRDRQGKLQAIKPGDAVAEGQEIVTAAGALVDVQLPSGAKLSIGPDRQVLLNDELFASSAPEPTENVVSSLGADADKVIQALNTGGDPFADLEDPAAGLTGGGNSDQTHDFVRLVRILEDVTPLAFNYTSSSDGIDFLPVSSIPAQPTTTAANQPPVAIDDPAFTTREDQATTVTVLTNDSDPDGDPISVTRASAPNGTVTLNPDGTLRYVPNPDFNGTDTITYTISDGKGGTASATVTVNVTPVNDPPVAQPDTAGTNEDTPVTFPVLGNDSDPDGDPLTVTGATVNPAQGSVVVNPDGTLSFTPAPNFTGPAQITYTIDDGKGGTTTAVVTVNVAPVNDPPVAQPDTAGTNEDTPVTFPVLGNDSDPDGDPLTVTGATVNPAQGSVVVNPDGTLSFTPAPNFTGPAQITYTISDGKGGTTTTVATVNVTPANDPATLGAGTGRVQEDTTLAASGILPITDPDAGEARFQPQTSTPGTYGSFSIDAAGAWSYALDNSNPVVQALKAGESRIETFSVQSADGTPTTVTITVLGTNDSPIARPDTARTNEDTPITFPVLGNDSDPDGDPLSVTGATVNRAQGSVVINPDGTLSFTPAPNFTGPAQITYTISDGKGGTSTAVVTVNVAPVNDAPVARNDSGRVEKNATLVVDLDNGLIASAGNAAGKDTDVDGDPLAITAIRTGAEAGSGSSGTVGSPLAGTYGSLTVDSKGGYTYVADRANGLAAGTTATDTFTYTISDGQGGTDTAELVIKITGTNDAAMISGVDIGTVTEDATLSTSGQLLATDVDSPAQFTAATATSTYGSFSIDTAGKWTYTLNNTDPAVQALGTNDVRTEQFTVRTADGSPHFVTINIKGANEAPTAINASPTGAEDAASIPVTLSGSDVDGTVVSFTLASLPTNGTLYLDAALTEKVLLGTPVSATSGAVGLFFKPNANWYGNTSFQFSATDDETASSSLATVTIEVTAVNDNPIAADNQGTVLEGGTLNAIPTNGLIASALDLNGKDTDVDGDPLAITAIRTGAEAGSGSSGTVGSPLAGTYGSLTVDSQGGYTYVADRANALAAGATATDTFTYTISDGQGGTDTAELVITIIGTGIGTNPVPEANPDTLAITENETKGGNVLTGAGLGGDVADLAPNGAPLVVTQVRTGSTSDTRVTADGTVIAGLHGSLTLKADGSYTYTATDDSLADGQTATDTFSYTVSDGQGGSSTTTLTVNITGTNDAPVVLATTANVSEEGLAQGEPDTAGSIDTTNAASLSGAISLTDVDGDALSVTLSAPADSLSSAGVPIIWSGSGTQALIGSAGGIEILRATVSDDGRYTVTLSGPIDHADTTGEDARSLDFGVNVSDGTTTVRSTLTLTVEDDAPRAAVISQTVEVAPIDTNLLLILDTSGSMIATDGVDGTSRLATAISALNQLLDSYDNFGEVRIRLVTFSDVSTTRGSGWMTVSDAKSLLGTLTPRGGTNYDAALAQAQSAFTTAGKLASGKNIAYFLSDGQPSTQSMGIDANEEASWKNFLSTNQIASYALGMGSQAVKSYLDPIAYDGTTNTNLDGQVITDFNKLASALQTTIPTPATGEILAGSLYGTGFGGDGGVVQSITVDGVTYTPDGSMGSIVTTGGTSNATYDATTHQIHVLTATGGTLILDYDTGSYTYTPIATIGATPISDGFDYVLTDKDGDSASSRVLFTASRMGENIITLAAPQQVSGTAGNDSITGSSGDDTILGGAGNDIIKGAGGVDLIAGGAGHDTLTGGAGADTFKWSLGDAGTAAAPAVDAITDFSTAAASSGGDVLDLRDLLQGESHTGNLAGNLGNYLHFEKIGADTVINISSTGGHTSGNYSTTDQKLVLQGVDLTGLGTDTQIIQNLLTNGKLNTD